MARTRPNASSAFSVDDKKRLDALARHPKEACAWVATAALPASTYTNGVLGVGARITASANGPWAPVDGVAGAVDQRGLVTVRSVAAEQGIYRLVHLGAADPGGAPWILERTTDADESADLVPGTTVWALQGTIYGDTEWYLNIDATAVVGTTALPWTRTGGPGGGGAGQLRTVTADTTVLPTDDYLLVNAVAGAVNVRLYDATGRSGESVHVKRLDTTGNVAQLLPPAGRQVEFGAQYALAGREAVHVLTDGIDWFIM